MLRVKQAKEQMEKEMLTEAETIEKEKNRYVAKKEKNRY